MSELTGITVVQRVLSAINADNVNAVDESPEGEQVFALLQTVYEELLEEFPWHHKRELFSFEVTTISNQMRIPEKIVQLADKDVIYYNRKPVYWIEPREMERRLVTADQTLSNVDSNGAYTDKDPTYWSSFDDDNIVFDAYNGTLAESLSQAWGVSSPVDYTNPVLPLDMPEVLASALIWGVMEEAFRTIKGDETSATRYSTKAKKAKARAKRWARKTNKEPDHGTNVNYARRGARNRTREISSRWIND